MEIRPFSIEIPDETLQDLRRRLAATRWPDEVEHAGWDYGTPVSFLRRLCAHWETQLDWRAIEARLNAVPQFIADVDGVPIHFVHLRGRGFPLLLTAGWPSCFAELLPLVPLLEDFDLVIPTLPGFCFSRPYTRRGPRGYHHLWAKLMEGLGYPRYGASGTDIGARVTSQLGRHYPERLAGIHLSSVDVEWPDPLPADLTADELDYVARVRRWEKEEGAYAELQGTAPQTLAYGLTDSPAGLAGWIVEKFRAWSDCGGDVESRFTFDELLTPITLFWATQTINSANRSYFDARHDRSPPPSTRIEAPTGVAMFPGEAQLVVPRTFVERMYRLVRWSPMPRGGHFAALEEPTLLAEDLRAFFGSLG